LSDAAEPPVRDPKEFLVFGSPQIEDAEIAEVLECLRSGWIGTGPRVARFESAFRAYRRASHAVAVNSCTAALHLSMLALRAEPGSEVITTPLTFCSTVNAIVHAGLRPVLADVDPVTMCIDPDEVAARVTDRTRIVLPVHFAGRACEMDALLGVADRHGLAVVEDCAHAIETEYRGRPVGTFGRFGCFSFYVTKNLVTGEGGMVLADRSEDADRIKILALHGMDKDAWKRFGDEGYKHYAVVECGFKYNMTDLQACLGLHQLDRIEENWLRRRRIWAVYQSELADLPLGLPAEPAPDSRHAYHLYTVRVDEDEAGIGRDAFLEGMTAENIGVGVHYRSVPTHPYYAESFGWRPEHYPHSFRIGEQTVSLPLSAKLTDRDVEDVLRATRKVLRAA
jgi:dTDP-4-amino-4,6-dideoxygalactose transaminase